MDKDASDQSTNQGQSGEALDKSLLVVDDDKVFCERLARAMSARGFTARTAMSVGEALAAIETAPPAFAVIDLRLGDGSGLDVMRALKARRADNDKEDSRRRKGDPNPSASATSPMCERAAASCWKTGSRMAEPGSISG